MLNILKTLIDQMEVLGEVGRWVCGRILAGLSDAGMVVVSWQGERTLAVLSYAGRVVEKGILSILFIVK